MLGIPLSRAFPFSHVYRYPVSVGRNLVIDEGQAPPLKNANDVPFHIANLNHMYLSNLRNMSTFKLLLLRYGWGGRHQYQGCDEENAYTTQNSNGHLALFHDYYLLLSLKIWDIAGDFRCDVM